MHNAELLGNGYIFHIDQQALLSHLNTQLSKMLDYVKPKNNLSMTILQKNPLLKVAQGNTKTLSISQSYCLDYISRNHSRTN